MLNKPRLKYCYHGEPIDEDKILLLSEKDSTLIPDPLYSEVLSHLLKDEVTFDQLLARLESKYSMFEVMTALTVLEKKGYITESSSSLPPGECAYWNSLGIHAHTLEGVLNEKPIAVELVGNLPSEPFLQAFSSVGLKTETKGALKVVITDDYEKEELRHINRDAIESGEPWMLVKPNGVDIWLGPVFIPGQTGCWECLRQRLKNNRPMITFYKSQKNTDELPPLPLVCLTPTLQIAANMVALEIVKWLYFNQWEKPEGKIRSLNTHTLETQIHTLVKRPQCKMCGGDNVGINGRPAPIILQKRSGRCATEQGGYREVPPESTIEKYGHHVSPITGIMQSLEPYHAIKGAPVYNYYSGINVALQSKTLFWLNYHIRGTNGGKGRSWSQAKVGALCEAIERYSCTYQGDEYEIIDSLENLGCAAIHPNDCMNFSDDQYRNREAINQESTKFYFLVPRPFDRSLKMAWAPVYSLTQQTVKYLPSCFCYAQYPAEDEMNLFCYPDSNGTAAGNSIEEAILQAFLELVERDSVALWWYNKLKRPSVDLASFDDPYFNRVCDFYKTLNRDLCVLDLTSDLTIPTFGAISHRTDSEKEEIIFAFGAHVDAKIAIERALVELNQILPIVNVSEERRAKGNYLTKDKIFIDWLETATRSNQPYLVPTENTWPKKASDYSVLCEPNIYESVMFCINQAAKQGLETLVLDMTRPDVGLNVAKVMVPGMRHFWKRLAPGRLYDVPVKMGWLDAPLKEKELNPIGLFI